MPRKKSTGSRRLVDSDDEEREVEDTEPTPSSRRGKRALPELMSLENDDDEAEDEENEKKSMFSSQAPDMTQDILPVRENERGNLLKLSEERREKAVCDLCRTVLFKALSGEAIDRSKCAKEAGITENRISTAAFREANERLSNIFGFELQRIPAWMEKVKGMPAKCKDQYYLINGLQDNDGEHGKAIHAVHTESAIEKGLLMIVLALAYCKGEPHNDGSRWILDKDLYSLLNTFDENIPSEPPAVGSRKKRTTQSQHSRGVRGDGALALTPDVDSSLDKLVKRDYLIKVKASDHQVAADSKVEVDSFYYSMGARSALEIGRKQVIVFCADILGEKPDPAMLNEVDGFDEGGDIES